LSPATDQGAGIFDVVPNSPAADAGVQPGDVVVSFDGRDISSGDELGAAIRDHRPGDVVDVVVDRPGGGRQTLRVTLGTNPVPTS
jgi:putative serine protease PepD